MKTLWRRVRSGIRLRIVKPVRTLYWKSVLGACGKNVSINGKIYIESPENVFIGNNVSLNYGVYLNGRSRLFIGDGVHISPNVSINTGSLDLVDRTQHVEQEVVIHDDVWLATGVIVNPDVVIGEGAVVGAGGVVTRDIPPYTLCVGVPARPMKDLKKIDTKELL